VTSPLAHRRTLGIAALLAGMAGCLAALGPVRDTDTFHHLALAREIARHGLPRVEPFLFPFQGAASAAPPYWLGSLAVGAAHALLGVTGLAALPALVGALLGAVLLADAAAGARSRIALAAAGAPVLLALAEYRLRAVARPEVFGVLLFAATLLACRRHADGKPRLLFAFPALALVWSNLHPSVTAGLAAVGLYAAWTAAAALLRRVRGGTPAPRAWVPAAVAMAACAAASLNPSPVSPIRQAVAFAASSIGVSGGQLGAATGAAAGTLSYLRHFVVEVQPLPPEAWRSPMALLLALAAAAALADLRRARPWELAIVAGLAWMSWSAARFAVFAAVAAAPVAGAVLARRADELVAKRRALAAVAAALALGGGAAAIAASGVPLSTALLARNLPLRAAEYLAALGRPVRAFAPMQFGGYLEWRLDAPAYQDGRGMLRPDEEEAAFGGPSSPAFAALDARWRFDALVLAYPLYSAEEVRAISAARPGDWAADRGTWALVAFDDGALLYLRRDGPLAARAIADEFRAALPANALAPAQLSDPAWVADMERALGEAPACVRCALHLAHARLAAGRDVEAEALATSALDERGPLRADALLVLGSAAIGRGDRGAARRWFEQAARGEARTTARRALAQLALDEGDLAAARASAEANLREGETQEDLELALAAAARAGDWAGAQALRSRLDRAARLSEAQEQHEQGLALAVAGRLPEAVAAYRRSLAIDDASAAAHSNLGWAYFDMGDAAAALREHGRALELDPSLAPAHYGRGLALRALGDVAGASRAFREYLRLEPRGAWSLKAEGELRAMGAR
jgi:tetratricopeptide (TPR) repeat protein